LTTAKNAFIRTRKHGQIGRGNRRPCHTAAVQFECRRTRPYNVFANGYAVPVCIHVCCTIYKQIDIVKVYAIDLGYKEGEYINGIDMYRQDYWIKGTYIANMLKEIPIIGAETLSNSHKSKRDKQ
jgi:hypothetical protein